MWIKYQFGFNGLTLLTIFVSVTSHNQCYFTTMFHVYQSIKQIYIVPYVTSESEVDGSMRD